VLWLLLAASLLLGCTSRGVGITGPATERGLATNTAPPPGWTEADTVLVYAVGDLGNKGDRDDRIASVIERRNPDAFLALGDIVYPHASAENFERFYDSSYGRLADITWPTPGNHDYRDGGIDAYLEYFGERSPRFPGEPYYVFQLGAWRIYSLNSEIEESEPGEPMFDWLVRDLQAHPQDCLGAMWHAPVYTAGSKEYDENNMRPVYDLLLQHDVDLVLTAHDHNYQRWDVDDTAYFVVGTGGKTRYDIDEEAPGLAYGNDQLNGALELELGPDGGTHVWRTMDDEALDRGSLGC
jgi:hypothetical protein